MQIREKVLAWASLSLRRSPTRDIVNVVMSTMSKGWSSGSISSTSNRVMNIGLILSISNRVMNAGLNLSTSCMVLSFALGIEGGENFTIPARVVNASLNGKYLELKRLLNRDPQFGVTQSFVQNLILQVMRDNQDTARLDMGIYYKGDHPFT